MKTKTKTDSRCCQCNRPFVPEPRVGDRQVTCGDGTCKRERHCERCRAWHANNGEVGKSHYEDVVAPFRRAQPDYQRRWRLGRRLREIREATGSVGGVLLTALGALLGRAEVLSTSPARQAQTGVLAGNWLGDAIAAMRGAIAAMEQLVAYVAKLRALRL